MIGLTERCGRWERNAGPQFISLPFKGRKEKGGKHPKGLDIVVDHTHMGRGMGGVRTGVRPSLI